MEVMFEVPESDIVCVKIDDQVVLGQKPIEFVRKPASDNESAPSTDSAQEEYSDAEKINESDEQKSKAKTYA